VLQPRELGAVDSEQDSRRCEFKYESDHTDYHHFHEWVLDFTLLVHVNAKRA